MRKLAVTLALIAASFALVASTAEAAKTSEREGRKFSRKYIKQDSRVDNYDWRQHQCYRIGRDGVGAYRIFPRGVACLFSAPARGGPVDCILYGVAVKDGRRHIQAANIAGIFPYRGDAADCDRGAPYPEWPPLWGGIKPDPLRPIAARPATDPGKRPPCEKRVDGVLRSIGTIGGNAGRRNVSCGKAKRVMKRYILHKKLPGDWECTNLRSFGKCADAGLPYSYGGNLNQQPFFNYEPGQRA